MQGKKLSLLEVSFPLFFFAIFVVKKWAAAKGCSGIFDVNALFAS